MMVDIWQQLQSFMGRGGPVLWVILALLVLTWRAFAQTLPRAACWPWALLCGLIGLSTLTTWQHGLADVMLGAALGALACWRLPR